MGKEGLKLTPGSLHVPFLESFLCPLYKAAIYSYEEEIPCQLSRDSSQGPFLFPSVGSLSGPRDTLDLGPHLQSWTILPSGLQDSLQLLWEEKAQTHSAQGFIFVFF